MKFYNKFICALTSIVILLTVVLPTFKVENRVYAEEVNDDEAKMQNTSQRFAEGLKNVKNWNFGTTTVSFQIYHQIYQSNFSGSTILSNADSNYVKFLSVRSKWTTTNNNVWLYG